MKKAQEWYDWFQENHNGQITVEGIVAIKAEATLELLLATTILVDHASEKYPHFESPRGRDDVERARITIAKVREAMG